MVKLSELRKADDVRADHMRDADYKREHDRTKLANDVAIKVIQYRVAHGLSQTKLAARLGMRQPNVARLESGDHEPSLQTLSLLAEVLKEDFSVDVKPGGLQLRHPARLAATPTERRTRQGRTSRIRRRNLEQAGLAPEPG